MEAIKFSDDVIEQIKNFNHNELTEEQRLVIDKLTLNEELKERYKDYGLCKECKQPNTNFDWCRSCNAKRFQQNFKNWNSENNNINKFIQNAQLKAKNENEVLEWIEYDRFENVEYLAKGGFGITYKAAWKDGYIYGWDSENNQWKRNCNGRQVALKCLQNSQDITAEFLKEIEPHLILNNAVNCYGITKAPGANNFMMVVEYAKNGSLRQYLNNNFNSWNWEKKLNILQIIAISLLDIHDKGLIHHDFHCGNILNPSNESSLIVDFGLCQLANVKSSQSDNKKIYGVLPYVAPEVLREKVYTQASDIYGFGIIAYEVCTGLPPYHDLDHGNELAISICQGLRPKSNYKIPQLILNMIKQCWDADPLKRPEARELFQLLSCVDAENEDNSLINKQIKESDEINNQSSSSSIGILSYTTHSQAVYTSRLLDFKNLPEPKNADE